LDFSAPYVDPKPPRGATNPRINLCGAYYAWTAKDPRTNRALSASVRPKLANSLVFYGQGTNPFIDCNRPANGTVEERRSLCRRAPVLRQQ
jgi:hypothetical protein